MIPRPEIPVAEADDHPRRFGRYAIERLDEREGEQPAPLQLDLVPVVGHLRVASEPDGASVFLDGEKVRVPWRVRQRFERAR
jgi:hypothetical protein